MAKPRAVSNLSCDTASDVEGKKVLRVRLDELLANRERVVTEGDSVALHDLRISAKRLRYSLETFAFCLSEMDVEAMADQVRGMQDVLGRIHDLDVMVSLLMGKVTEMDDDSRVRALTVASLHVDAGDRANALLTLIDDRENMESRLGFYQVIGEKLTERSRKYAEFEALWQQWTQDGVLADIEALLQTA